MTDHEAVRSFLEGRSGPWATVRRLVRAGLTAGAALALVTGLPEVARGERSFDDLAKRVRRSGREGAKQQRRLEGLLERIGGALRVAVQADELSPLSAGLARLGANVNAPRDQPVSLNVDSRAGRLPVQLSGIVLNLGNHDGVRNTQVSVGGLVGNLPVNLSGTVEVPLNDAPGRNVNLGNVNLNFFGNAGNARLDFVGNVGNVARNTPDQP